jgi:prephenate dehydratase
LETGLEAMPLAPGHALLACAVYPQLHTLVFSNLHRIALADAFVMPTFEMVLASRDGHSPDVVATHPAPQGLVPEGRKRVLVNSNAQAAIDCAEGRTDGCITTSKAAAAHGLKIVSNHGAVPMVFTLHAPLVGAR